MSANRPLTPQNLVHLLHRASQFAESLFDKAAPGVAVTARQLVVLDAIASLDDPSQTDICRQCGIDRSTLADIVRRLVHRRFLTRRRTREDARRYALRVTPEGLAMLERHRPLLQAVDSEFAGLLNHREQREFLETLTKIAKAADTTGSE